MGQYFRAVDKTKKEVVCPWCLGGVAKLIEWAANPWGPVFTLLLRRSDGSGGGDFYGYRTQVVDLSNVSSEGVAHTLSKMALMEGKSFDAEADSVVGRWAGDEVYLVGDYDSSDLYEESKGYRNISREVVEAWNSFMDIKEMQLEYNQNCSCQAPVEVTK
jgi:hypothetical protein